MFLLSSVCIVLVLASVGSWPILNKKIRKVSEMAKFLRRKGDMPASRRVFARKKEMLVHAVLVLQIRLRLDSRGGLVVGTKRFCYHLVRHYCQDRVSFERRSNAAKVAIARVLSKLNCGDELNHGDWGEAFDALDQLKVNTLVAECRIRNSIFYWKRNMIPVAVLESQWALSSLKNLIRKHQFSGSMPQATKELKRQIGVCIKCCQAKQVPVYQLVRLWFSIDALPFSTGFIFPSLKRLQQLSGLIRIERDYKVAIKELETIQRELLDPPSGNGESNFGPSRNPSPIFTQVI